MANSIQRAALAGLAILALSGACRREPNAPPPQLPGPQARPQSAAFMQSPGTYFERWPDLDVEPVRGEDGPERFLPLDPGDAGAPEGPVSQRPLRMLQPR